MTRTQIKMILNQKRFQGGDHWLHKRVERTHDPLCLVAYEDFPDDLKPQLADGSWHKSFNHRLHKIMIPGLPYLWKSDVVKLGIGEWFEIGSRFGTRTNLDNGKFLSRFTRIKGKVMLGLRGSSLSYHLDSIEEAERAAFEFESFLREKLFRQYEGKIQELIDLINDIGNDSSHYWGQTLMGCFISVGWELADHEWNDILMDTRFVLELS